MVGALSEACSNCGSEIPDGNAFCGKCGTALVRSEPVVERRLLTVLFCDLVGSTNLSDTLDPEDLRDITNAYHVASVKVIEAYDGHIAQYLGDGLLVYYGYPVAHEDDARRAGLTALGILREIEALSQRLQSQRQLELQVRIGIHTGPVVVGEVGEGNRRENLALGRTPNVAARIQSFAQPGTALISREAFNIAHGYFDCEELGRHQLKGIAEPIEMYRLVLESGADSRLDAARRAGLTGFTGRAAEQEQLRQAWQEARSLNASKTLLISGEAGIGKSRLVAKLVEDVVYLDAITLQGACTTYSTNTALHPIADAVQRLLDHESAGAESQGFASLERKLKELNVCSDENLNALAELLHLESSLSANFQKPSPERLRDHTLAGVEALLLAMAQQQPTLFIIEDVHWADPTTLEFLSELTEKQLEVPLVVLLTYRSEFGNPIEDSSFATSLRLQPLSDDDCAGMIMRVTRGKALPPEVMAQIVSRCEGVPLYAEEITKAVLDLGVLVERSDAYEAQGRLPSDLVPATVHSTLTARLDSLEEAKPIAQLAAIIGREFRLDLLAAVFTEPRKLLMQGLDRLLDAGIIYPTDTSGNSSFEFKHALLQDAAYQSLLKSARRQQHRKIAETLSTEFQSEAKRRPELVAQHFAAGDRPDLASIHWLAAGKSAVGKAANREGLAHLSNALQQIELLPESLSRDERELECHFQKLVAQQTILGWAAPEVEQTFDAATTLVERLDQPPLHAELSRHLMTFHFVRGNISEAVAISRQNVEAAKPMGNPAILAAALCTLCVAELYNGNIDIAIECGEAALAKIDRDSDRLMAAQAGFSVEVNGSSYLSEACWMRGFPDKARAYSERARSAARELANESVEIFGVGYSAEFYHLLQDRTMILEIAAQSKRLTEGHRSDFWDPMLSAYSGWAIAVPGRYDEGIRMLKDGIRRYVEGGSGITRVHLLVMLAATLIEAQRLEEAELVLDEAETVADEAGEVFYLPELHRIRGEALVAAQGDPIAVDANSKRAAIDHFRKALSVAESQNALSLQLRAAMSLARLERSETSINLLRGLLAEFKEGFETSDLVAAHQLLRDLESKVPAHS